MGLGGVQGRKVALGFVEFGEVVKSAQVGDAFGVVLGDGDLFSSFLFLAEGCSTFEKAQRGHLFLNLLHQHRIR